MCFCVWVLVGWDWNYFFNLSNRLPLAKWVVPKVLFKILLVLEALWELKPHDLSSWHYGLEKPSFTKNFTFVLILKMSSCWISARVFTIYMDSADKILLTNFILSGGLSSCIALTTKYFQSQSKKQEWASTLATKHRPLSYTRKHESNIFRTALVLSFIMLWF